MRVPVHSRAALLALSVLLLLAYGFTRVIGLTTFPAFLDEVDHILWARDVYDLRPFTGAINGKLFGLWWMAAFDLRGDASLFLVRAATVLFQMLTVAGIIRLGWRLGSASVGLLAAALYVPSPYAFFYDRMALVDPYVVAFGVLLALASVEAALTGRRRWALLAAAMLIGAILAKATGVMLFAVPLAALLLLGRRKAGERVRLLLLALGGAAVVWLLLRWRGYSYFSTAQNVVGTTDNGQALERLLHNLFSVDGILSLNASFHTWPFVALVMAAAVVVGLRWGRRGWFLVAALALPLGGLLLFAVKLSPRYFHFHLPFAYLIAAAGVVLLADALGRRTRVALAAGLLIVWGGLVSVPFMAHHLTDPATLPLPRLDRLEYVESDAAGFAIPQAAAYLAQQGVTGFSGWLSNCQAVTYYTTAAVDCLPQSTDPARQRAVIDALNTAPPGLWLVYEASAFTTLEGLSLRYEVQAVFPRPGYRTRLVILRGGD